MIRLLFKGIGLVVVGTVTYVVTQAFKPELDTVARKTREAFDNKVKEAKAEAAASGYYN